MGLWLHGTSILAEGHGDAPIGVFGPCVGQLHGHEQQCTPITTSPISSARTSFQPTSRFSLRADTFTNICTTNVAWTNYFENNEYGQYGWFTRPGAYAFTCTNGKPVQQQRRSFVWHQYSYRAASYWLLCDNFSICTNGLVTNTANSNISQLIICTQIFCQTLCWLPTSPRRPLMWTMSRVVLQSQMITSRPL